ncbi:acyl-coenzyme A synthetase/AMP-(fatty) acid ligase [Salirhabdus euzebyi]|uniref:Acyl-coenzyme A synthetase/AMP-(Fatty) acid ligase n=1 Tax=Salirhabdus euzebyi TaxID=394506 RepID=A0A841Q6Z1_9BACI|nr:acyl-coenzyme A synthetase/AMP-(fatty) acid ligase [Salirhabdus euzebyi]
MYATTGKLFELTVQSYAKKEAIVDVTKGIRWTYEEWDKEVNKLANALRASGVDKGDVVSTYLFNTIELANVFFACGKIGAILNPINFRLKSQDIEYIFKDSAPKVVLFEKALEPHVNAIHKNFGHISFWYVDNDTPSYAVNYYERVKNASIERPFVDISENDTYAIMYTSGTTGRPKGVMHRHRDMVEQSLTCVAVFV